MEAKKLRLEPSVKEAVAERARTILENAERATMSLSGAGPHEGLLESLLLDIATIKASCLAVRAYEPLSDTLVEFEGLITAAKQGQVALDERFGGLCLQVINTTRHALSNLGEKNRAAEMLPRLLQNLNRVIKAAKQKTRQAEPEAAPVHQAQTQEQPTYKDYEEAFLRDDAKYFDQIKALSRKLSEELNDTETQQELFRLVHTVKGNAMAFGFGALAEYAGAFEELMVELRNGNPAITAIAPRMIEHAAVNLLARVEQARKVAEGKPEAQEKIKSNLFALTVKAGGRDLVIPCEAVGEVLLNPKVMAVPGGRKGWLGVIRASGALLPLLETDETVAGSKPAWAVVLTNGENRFSIPADEVGQVIELADASSMLDVSSLLKNTG